MGLIDCDSNGRAARWLRAAILLLAALAVSPGLLAQPVVADPELPQPRDLAAALSDPDSRADALLTLLAVQRLADYGRYARAHEVDAYAERFRGERDWLDRLSARYESLPLRSSLLDPSAWLLTLELDQYDLSPGPAVSPFGPPARDILAMLFDEASELPAATVLPVALSRVESRATALWRSVLAEAGRNVALRQILLALNEEWFDPWEAAEPPAPAAAADRSDVETALALLLDAAAMAQRAGPPDGLDLKRLRFRLLGALPDLDWQQAIDAAYLLGLANAVEGLYEGRYLAFSESMLWVAAGLLAAELPREPSPPEPAQDGPFPPLPEIVLEPLPGELVPPPPPEPYRSPLPVALADLLPALSQAFSHEFDRVDPRLNVALASVFDVVQYIGSGQGDPSQLSSLRFGLADSVAQLALLMPDMDYYFSQPVRVSIAEEINICISRASRRDAAGAFALSRDEFDRCLNGLARLASTRLNAAELSGDPDGPFGMVQLQRELDLSPWQRINYLLGYLLEANDTGCPAPAEPLPNPLEWASLVTVTTWFARQAPVYFQAPENEILVSGLRRQGRDLLEALALQVDCISGAGSGINDPVNRALAGYRSEFESLAAGIRAAELAFREERLAAGADIMLDGGPGQRTAFRPEGLSVGPCDGRYVCEMTASLEPGNDLVGLFPEPYRVAHQAGMGEVGLCYDNVQWVERRSEPVREDDPHVANYFGRFSFDLFGTFSRDDDTEPVFGFNFVSPEEYHYLFGPSGDEVLAAGCPAEWVGTRIVTGLGNRAPIRVVPDRLTYLAAARTLPSALFAANWTRNQNWRDAFVSGQGVRPLEVVPDPAFGERLGQYLQGLHRAQQASVYNALLNPPPSSWRGTPDSLHGQLQALDARKALVRANLNIFYPLTLVESDGIRGLLEGNDALPDSRQLRRLRRENVPVSSIPRAGRDRLESIRAEWQGQPETLRRGGSAAISLVHALVRLDALYRDFFATPPAPPPEPVNDSDRLDFGELSG